MQRKWGWGAPPPRWLEQAARKVGGTGWQGRQGQATNPGGQVGLSTWGGLYEYSKFVSQLVRDRRQQKSVGPSDLIRHATLHRAAGEGARGMRVREASHKPSSVPSCLHMACREHQMHHPSKEDSAGKCP